MSATAGSVRWLYQREPHSGTFPATLDHNGQLCWGCFQVVAYGDTVVFLDPDDPDDTELLHARCALDEEVPDEQVV